MAKKRYLLAILIVAILLITSSQVFAGCCKGIIGCSRAFFESECSGLATFDSSECEEINDCDIVACCHNITGIPRATYRATCFSMNPLPTMHDIKPFTTNPSSEIAYANSLCAGGKPSCTYVNCENANVVDCMCGSTLTKAGSLYCCGRDSSVFSSLGLCSVSPSCKVGNFYNIHGKVITPEGIGIAGADVRAGGKQVLTDDKGNYTIELLPDKSSGTVVAIKNSTINSTQYSISGAEVFGLDIVLKVSALPGTFEDCTNMYDDNGNQGRWNSTPTDAADRCDVECNGKMDRPNLKKTVTKTYYNSLGEYYKDGVTGKVHDLCSDGYDNDCNGYADCEDTNCKDSPACRNTTCGDGFIAFPNSKGQYEQCDKNYTSGVGNDSLCPGKCVEKGKPGECTCKYEAACGNTVIDEPLEDCDGTFIASRNEWAGDLKISASFKGSCDASSCGKPGSVRPCQCPPPQICGNGEVEKPEECDLNECGSGIACNPDCTCPAKVAVCGNNLIEYREDCDGVLKTGGLAWESFKTRKYGCNPAFCAVPKLPEITSGHPTYKAPGNVSTTSYAQYTKDYDYYLDILNVDSSCKCPTSCKVDPPGPDVTSVKPTRFERKINITWKDECMNENAKAYNVLRCEASGPDGEGCTDENSRYTVINSAPLGVAKEFMDTTFEGSTPTLDRYYCYYAQGIYNKMVGPNAVVPDNFENFLYRKGELDTNISCIKAGMEQCFTFKETHLWADEFCSQLNENVRSTCDENNSIVTVTPTSGDDKVDCNEREQGVGESYTDFVCIGPYAEDFTDLNKRGKTECVPKSLCDYCNDPLGMFGFSGVNGESWNQISYSASGAYGKAPTSEPTSLFEKENRVGYLPCNTLDICYMDYSATSVNKFYSASQESTCYDFKSEHACEKFNETDGNCEWVWHPVYRELGIGVCRSKIADQQLCERCHDPENEVFNHCDINSCALYGRCYYDKANLVGETNTFQSLAKLSPANPVKLAQREGNIQGGDYYRCTPERDIACENYDTMQDCIGSPSPYSINSTDVIRTDVIVDVNGTTRSDSKFIKKSGTNIVVNVSDDFFGFGKCQWVRPYFINTSYYENDVMIRNDTDGKKYICVKNSDNSPGKVKDVITNGADGKKAKEDYFYQQDSDCGGTGYYFRPPLSVPASRIKDCWKDFTSPATTLPLYDDLTNPMRIKGVFEIPAVVQDESLIYSTAYSTTFACVASSGLTCYPNGTADFVGMEAGNLITHHNVGYNVSYNFSEKGFQTGRHVLWYFSEDVSHNLELVKNYTVFIDADAPNITLEFRNISYETHEDVWRTNLTLTVRVSPQKAGDDVYAFCSAKMYIGNISIYPLQDIFQEYNNSWTRNYTEMYDDVYTFQYSCEDDVGNKAEKNVTFRIEGDKSVTNPLPVGTLNSADVVISVETGTNSECRYLLSVVDNPAYNPNATLDQSFFDTMTRFEVTGNDADPRTIHSSRVVAVQGYNRYYVKCRSILDGKIRGNNADQIRFAIDMVPPVSGHSTDSVPYNGWYNKDVMVSLLCGDPPILGEGLDWSFGCMYSQYCIGLDCSDRGDVKFQDYTGEFLLNDTQYVTYYSVDEGDNQEEYVKNVLFQIDKTPVNVTIDFYEGDVLATVIIPNIVYKIVVNSSKPLISPAVSVPTMTYSSQPGKFAGDIELFPTNDPSIWEGVFFLENINANRGFEGDGIFSVSGDDYHKVPFSATKVISIDTKPPAQPVVEPSLELPSREESDYQSMGYPVNYYDGIYYTNQSPLFITGSTSELLDIIAVTTVDDVDTQKTFTQTPTLVKYNDTVLSGFVGQHELKVAGDITRRINDSLFIGFDDLQESIGPKTSYGNYGMFYDINSVKFVGGDSQYTSVIVYPVLEESLKLDRKLFFYYKENPSYWFGFDLPLAQFKNTSFYLKAYDPATNMVRYPDISIIPPYLVFFYDPISPQVLSHYPLDGTTSKTTLDVIVRVKEGRLESGLFNSSINFTLNGKAVPFRMVHLGELEDADPGNYYYSIIYSASNLKDGNYTVAVTGSDLAMNRLDESQASSHWTFIVDRKAPQEPVVTFIDGFAGPPGDTRWYIDHSPEFIVNFSAERDPVTLVDTYMEDSPTEGGAANCTNISRNIFRCAFTTPKTSTGVPWGDYGVIIVAYKTLADKTRSNDAVYGPFSFTVDDTAPEFVPAFQTRFMDSINLTIAAVVSNERHPIFADLEFLGEHFTPLYSRNNGSFYYFTWSIPKYDKSKEGNTTMQVTLSDFARNKRSVSVPVYLDLTAPRIENITIDVSNTVKIGKERFTAQPTVTVSGIFIDDDIKQVWTEPGDYNATTGKTEPRAYGTIKYEGGASKSFTLSVKLVDPNAGKIEQVPFLYNEMLINQINNLKLFAVDIAGHKKSIDLRVIRDVTAPNAPTFCLGAEWYKCIPLPVAAQI